MIGKLRGKVDKISENNIILDVSGVGYLVFCSNNTISAIGGNEGVEASLLIETVVREDQITLYGFADEFEKSWFLQLNKVNGVGPKMALSILSAMRPSELSLAIAAQDKGAFKRISGVGPKLSERLMVELKGASEKLGSGAGNVVQLSSTITAKNSPESNANNNLNDAASALEKLGFNRSDAYSVISKVLSVDKDAGLDKLIKEGLKALAGGAR